MNTVKAYEEIIDFIAAGTTPKNAKRIVSESDGKSRSLIQNREVMYRTLTYY